MFLYCPLTSWNFKSVKIPVALYTDLFLYNSVCHQRLSRGFLLLDSTWCTAVKAVLATCKHIFPPVAANSGESKRAARSPSCAPSRPNLNVGASRNPRDYVTLLRCGRMFKVCTRPYIAQCNYQSTDWKELESSVTIKDTICKHTMVPETPTAGLMLSLCVCARVCVCVCAHVTCEVFQQTIFLFEHVTTDKCTSQYKQTYPFCMCFSTCGKTQ
jgi:hypothetical protein